jgi:uncharacterized metal-binding protein YceD (DUF177 family)
VKPLAEEAGVPYLLEGGPDRGEPLPCGRRNRLTDAGHDPNLTGVFRAASGIFGDLAILTNEFSRRLAVEPWPDEGVTVDVSADAAERRSLTERFELLEVRALRGHGRLERRGAELVLRGWLEADVVQECVVSLEPVPATIREPVERRYRLGGAADAARARLEPHGTIVLDDDEDEVEPVIGREIDLGEAFAEELGLALEPYPRASGAPALESGALGPHVTIGSEDRPSRPFAALRQLREKHAR